MAQACGAKRLIVSHSTSHLTGPGSRERGIGDMARIYSGKIVFAEGLKVLDL